MPQRLRRVIGPLFVLLALGLGAWAVIGKRHELGAAFDRLSWGWVAGAFLLALASSATSMFVFRSLLSGLGSHIPVPAAARVVYLGQLGKYLPGSVWAVLGQTELARELHVPRNRSLVASLVGIGVSVVSGLLFGAVLLPLSSPHTLHRFWPALIAIPFLVVCLHPKVLAWLSGIAFRVLRREPPDRPLPLGAIAGSAGWQSLVWVLTGVQGYLLVEGMGATDGARALPIAIGSFAFAFAAGLLFIPAPAGAGVREAVLVAALSPVLAVAPALAVALLSRVLYTAADFLLAGAAAARSRVARSRAAV